jgi:hypothetical protein
MRHKIVDRHSRHLHPRVNLYDRHMSPPTTEGFYLIQPFAYLLFSNCTLRITLIMTRLTLERTSQLRQWLADEGFRSPTKAERQKLAFSLNCHEQQVRRSIKQLQSECGKSRTWGISTETELVLQRWSASNSDRLNPSDEEINAISELLRKVGRNDISCWFHKKNRFRNLSAHPRKSHLRNSRDSGPGHSIIVNLP